MGWGILDGLDEADRTRVLESAVRRQFRRGVSIIRQGEFGDALHLIEQGRAMVQVTTPDGDAVTFAVIGPGEYFGEQALLDDGKLRIAAVVALEPVATLALRRTDFDRLRQTHPTIDGVLVRALSERVNRLTEQLIEVLFVSAEQRVHRRLRDLSAIYGQASHSGPVSIGLTQEQLAEIAGTSRPTVNRVLAELGRADIVSVRRGSVVIEDPIGLAERSA